MVLDIVVVVMAKPLWVTLHVKVLFAYVNLLVVVATILVVLHAGLHAASGNLATRGAQVVGIKI